MFLNGNETEPEVMTVDQDFINLEQMVFTLNTQIVKGTPRWGQRAYAALHDFNMNAVVYYMPEAGT